MVNLIEPYGSVNINMWLTPTSARNGPGNKKECKAWTEFAGLTLTPAEQNYMSVNPGYGICAEEDGSPQTLFARENNTAIPELV